MKLADDAEMRLKELKSTFSYLSGVLDTLMSEKVYFLIGGSAALYLQGARRRPHDIDLMFTPESHRRANRLFGLEQQFIQRPTVTMYKSSPVDDGSVDFLSQYTVTNNGTEYHSNPVEKVDLVTGNSTYYLVPAEKILVFKLIGRRLHHQDIEDVKQIVAECEIDKELFWHLASQQNAEQPVRQLLAADGIII